MSYILDLRKQVGHAPLISVGSAVLVNNSAGELLLVKRNDNFQWGLPAGSMELGETLEETAKRELFEETGLTATTVQFKQVFSGEPLHYRYPNSDEIYGVTALYQTNQVTGKIKEQTNETLAAQWFVPSELPDQLTPITRYLLASIQ